MTSAPLTAQHPSTVDRSRSLRVVNFGTSAGTRIAVVLLIVACLAVSACRNSPYPPYWDADNPLAPTLNAIEPASVISFAGGQELVLNGSNLESTQTVVIGDRNALIVDTSPNSVTVQMPARSGGDGALDVALVTLNGVARLDDALTYAGPGADWWSGEVASISVVTTECPIEAYAYWVDDWYPLFWCGFEMGWSSASGIVGSGPQPGFAADMSGYLPLSLAPAPGEFSYWDASMPVLPKLPDRYAPTPASDEIWVQTARDFERDLARIDTQLQRIADYYSYYDDVVAAYPTVGVYGDDTCFVADAGLVDWDAGTLTLDGVVEGAAAVWLGVGVEEDFDGEILYGEGFLSSSWVTAEGAVLAGDSTGPFLFYDDFSGTFVGDGAAGLLGVADVPDSVRYEVVYASDKQSVLGEMEGPAPFVVTDPDLLSGLAQILQSTSFDLSWTPIPARESPTLVTAEIRIYDYSADHPTGSLEVARLTGSAVADSGSLSFPASELAKLPIAPNEIDDNDELIGLWGEISVVAHQLRRVPYKNGHMVVDFAHAVSTPIDVVAE